MGEYRQEITEWQQQRDASLRRENGWLALAGLFWLDNGENTVGGDPDNNVVLPGESAPAHLGVFEVKGETVRFRAMGEHSVKINNRKTVRAMLRSDHDERPSFITLGSLRMVVIERGNLFALRVWDNARPERKSFPGRAWFTIDERLRVSARYFLYGSPKVIELPDVSGNLQHETMAGYLSFDLFGQTRTLDAAKEEKDYFVMFKDLTSGLETYPAGRYLVADMLADDMADLDFNKAYNPPCAFTDFATCAFAPPQNHLGLRIEAGERYDTTH